MSTASAGFWRRLAALGYDLFLLFAIWWAITALYLLGLNAQLGDAMIGANGRVETGMLLRVLLLAGTIVFFCYFWMRNGQTLGMQSWGLQIQASDGSRPTLRHCLVRCLAAVLSAACLGAGYLWMLLDRDGMTWHDRLSGTRVVRVS